MAQDDFGSQVLPVDHTVLMAESNQLRQAVPSFDLSVADISE